MERRDRGRDVERSGESLGACLLGSFGAARLAQGGDEREQLEPVAQGAGLGRFHIGEQRGEVQVSGRFGERRGDDGRAHGSLGGVEVQVALEPLTVAGVEFDGGFGGAVGPRRGGGGFGPDGDHIRAAGVGVDADDGDGGGAAGACGERGELIEVCVGSPLEVDQSLHIFGQLVGGLGWGVVLAHGITGRTARRVPVSTTRG